MFGRSLKNVEVGCQPVCAHDRLEAHQHISSLTARISTGSSLLRWAARMPRFKKTALPYRAFALQCLPQHLATIQGMRRLRRLRGMLLVERLLFGSHSNDAVGRSGCSGLLQEFK